MKTELNSSDITLIAENFADKLYIATFLKNLEENSVGDDNIEASFSYSEGRMNENAPKGGGWLDRTRLVDTLFDAEKDYYSKKRLIAIEEITELTIHNYPI